MVTASFFQIAFQLLLAVGLGAFIGFEREFKRKRAGLQTYALVSLGACIFAIIAFQLVDYKLQTIDVSRIIQAIAIGIGFIGGGVIFQRPSKIEGLTTAAGLWVAGSIGLAVGIKFYFLAVLATFFTISILTGLGVIEEKFFKKKEI